MPAAVFGQWGSLWLRTVLATVALATATAGLLAVEAAIVGVVAYAAVVLLVGAVEPVAPGPFGTVAVVLAFLAAAAVVLGAYRAVRRDRGGRAVTGIVVYAGIALVAASLVVTYLAIDAAGLPRWTFGVVFAVLLVLVYPAVGLRAARDAEGGKPATVDDPFANEDRPGASEAARAVATELRAAASDAVASLGTAGTAAALAVVVGALAVIVATDVPPSALVGPLPAVAGAAVAVGHVADVVRSELADEGVLAALSEDLGPPADDDERAAIDARVARLAATFDVAVPAVRLRRSRTPTAAVVGVRPSDATLVVSTGLVETLPADELDAVLAHELAHVVNRDAAVLTVLSVPRAAARRALARYGVNPVVGLLAGATALVARGCVAVVARDREHAADDAAVAATADPAALAAALERLDETLARRPEADLRGVAAPFAVVPPPWEEHRFFDRTRRFVDRRLFGTHPPTERRIERLRARIGEE